jgi:hypothetical protein
LFKGHEYDYVVAMQINYLPTWDLLRDRPGTPFDSTEFMHIPALGLLFGLVCRLLDSAIAVN